jgi:hypothetical protein
MIQNGAINICKVCQAQDATKRFSITFPNNLPQISE